MMRAALRSILRRLGVGTGGDGGRPGSIAAPYGVASGESANPGGLDAQLDLKGAVAGAWIACWRAAPRLPVDVSDEVIARVTALDPERVQATVAAADRIVAHEFTLLGSGPFEPVDPDRPPRAGGYRPIDWRLDPVRGLRFPSGIPHDKWDLYAMRPGNADIKLPWELARCQHWTALGQAWRLTGRSLYAQEIARQLEDFVEANPVGNGIHWTCTMDVALRAVSWAIGLSLVRKCGELGDEFWLASFRALHAHGDFVARNLENRYEVTSNHFLSNVVGLFVLSAVFRDLASGARWDDFCRKALDTEIGVQVLADGADFESSIPYHRLVTELFLGAWRVAQYSERSLPVEFRDRLIAMVDLMAAVLRPDGLMPQVGDADDGRLHVLADHGKWERRDPRHLFAPAALALGERRWLDLAGPAAAWEAAWWGFDPAPVAAVPHDARRERLCRLFPDAGLAVAREADRYLLITNGIVGTRGFGNHKHNDLLSFEYHHGGRAFVVDPGSFVYTSDFDARNRFRGTAAHSTIAVDGQEQNEVRPEWLFRMFENANPEHLEFSVAPDHVVYRGRHSGYARLAAPVVHERAFRYETDTGRLAIADRVSGRGRHGLRWAFSLAPGVAVIARGAGQFRLETEGVAVDLIGPPDPGWRVEDSWYSPSYGVRVRASALVLETLVDLDGAPGGGAGCPDFAFWLEPADDGADAPPRRNATWAALRARLGSTPSIREGRA
jgi:hypothetical protein